MTYFYVWHTFIIYCTCEYSDRRRLEAANTNPKSYTADSPPENGGNKFSQPRIYIAVGPLRAVKSALWSDNTGLAVTLQMKKFV